MPEEEDNDGPLKATILIEGAMISMCIDTVVCWSVLNQKVYWK